MLKLKHLPDVHQVVMTRDIALGKLRALKRGDFVVTIAGHERESGEVKHLVQPVLERHLNAHIGRMNHMLGIYGVDVLD